MGDLRSGRATAVDRRGETVQDVEFVGWETSDERPGPRSLDYRTRRNQVERADVIARLGVQVPPVGAELSRMITRERVQTRGRVEAVTLEAQRISDSRWVNVDNARVFTNNPADYTRERITYTDQQVIDAAVGRYTERANRLNYRGDMRRTSYAGQIAAAQDDAYHRPDLSSNTWNASYCYFRSGTALNQMYHGGLRWTGVAIPSGATIIAATITCDLVTSGRAQTDGTIYFELASNPGNFTSQPIGSRNRTSASVVTFEDFSGPMVATFDVTACVQEVVNQGGWASGQAMVALFIANMTAQRWLQWWGYNGDPARAATLDVDFTEGGAPGGMDPLFFGGGI